jgi:hypothetical protein
MSTALRPEVFISHAREDALLARRLRQALGRQGLQAFTLEEIRSGKNVVDMVEIALRTASYYVVLVSEQALSSPSVNFEIGAAIGQEKKLIPVFLTKHAQRGAPAPLRHRVGIFAEHMSPDDIAARIVGSIEAKAA